MKFSNRLDKIPPYFFVELDKMKQKKIAQGIDVISLGIGDPDMPTSDNVVKAMQEAVKKSIHHQYPPNGGTKTYREALSNFYKKRFNTYLNPEGEIIDLIGSKEGIAHISMAVLDPGDILLVPDPGYPVYSISAAFAGADVYKMPLKKENGFLPDFNKIPEDIFKRAKMMFLNYPNNPTAAGAGIDFFKEAVSFAKKYDIIIASDNAYGEIYYSKDAPPSILQVEGAKDIAVEFYSLSKPYNMTGWRVAACLGNEKICNALKTFKGNIDSGNFTAVQEVAAYALNNCDDFVSSMREVYKKRRDKVIDGLKSMGIEIEPPQYTFYIWAPVPNGLTSMNYTGQLLDKTGVLVSPGNGFGDNGEGYFRISLTQRDERIDEAVERLKESCKVISN